MRIRLPIAALALALMAAGCSDDSSDRSTAAGPSGPASSSGSASPSDQPKPLYAAELEQVADGAATLTNTGRRKDRYVVQLLPFEAGAAAPATLELAPGASAPITFVMAPELPEGADPVLIAHSTTSGRDVRVEID